MEALPFQSSLGVNFATGAKNEIKLWNGRQCIHIIHNAHQSQIYSIKSFLTAEQSVNVQAGNNVLVDANGAAQIEFDRYGRDINQRNENIMILTGGKDKSLKLWRLKRREDGEIRRDNLNG